jgi:hypothetical protein
LLIKSAADASSARYRLIFLQGVTEPFTRGKCLVEHAVPFGVWVLHVVEIEQRANQTIRLKRFVKIALEDGQTIPQFGF